MSNKSSFLSKLKRERTSCYTYATAGETILKLLIKKKYLREHPEGRKHVVFLPKDTFAHVRQTICPELERRHAAVVGDAFLIFMLLVIAFTLINFTIYFLFSHLHSTPTTPRKDKGKAVDRGNGLFAQPVPTVQDDSEDEEDDTSSATDSDAHDGAGSSHTILGQDQESPIPTSFPNRVPASPTRRSPIMIPTDQHLSPEYFRTQWMTSPRRDFAYRLTPSKETNEWRNLHSTIFEQHEPSERCEPAEQHHPVNDDHFTTGETVSLAQSTQSDLASYMSVTAPLPAVPSGTLVASTGTAVVNDQGIGQPEYAQAKSVPADGPVNVDGYRTLTQDEIGWQVHAIAIQRSQATPAPSPGTTPRYFDSEEAIGIVKYCNSSNYFGITLPPRNLPESMGTVDDRLQSIAADILLGLVESRYADCIPQIVKYVQWGFAMTWVGHREMPPLVELTEKQQAAINVWKPTVPTPCCFPVNWVPDTFQVPVELYSPDFGIFDMCICLVISVTDRESYAYFPEITALLYAAFGDPNDPVSKQVISDGALGQQLRDCLAQRKGRYLKNTAQGVNAHGLNQDRARGRHSLLLDSIIPLRPLLGTAMMVPRPLFTPVKTRPNSRSVLSFNPNKISGMRFALDWRRTRCRHSKSHARYFVQMAWQGFTHDLPLTGGVSVPGNVESPREAQPEQNIGHETWNVDNGYASSQGQIPGNVEHPHEAQILGYAEPPRESQIASQTLLDPRIPRVPPSETEGLPQDTLRGEKHSEGGAVGTESTPGGSNKKKKKKKKKKTITNGDPVEILQYIDPAITVQPPEDDTESLSTPRKAHPLPAEKKGGMRNGMGCDGASARGLHANSQPLNLFQHRNRGTTVSASSPDNSTIVATVPTHDRMVVLQETFITSPRRQDQVTNSDSVGLSWLGPRPPAANSVSVLPRTVSVGTAAPTNGLVVHRQHPSGSVPRGTATSPSETLTTHEVLTKQTFKFSDVLEVNDLTQSDHG
ncbi:hypothetical protein BU17DRAFT_100719 [Hysterangium stoloniferum]|nr:hypothetical protein BU17DRAFT_100719 [Hysterangium stoloniferum]